MHLLKNMRVMIRRRRRQRVRNCLMMMLIIMLVTILMTILELMRLLRAQHARGRTMEIMVSHLKFINHYLQRKEEQEKN